MMKKYMIHSTYSLHFLVVKYVPVGYNLGYIGTYLTSMM